MNDQEFMTIREDLLQYLTRLTGNPTVADDLTQDAFIRVLGKGLQDKGVEEFRAYLFRTAMNLMIDRKRSLDRRPQAEEFDEELTLPNGTPDLEEGPLMLAIRSEMNDCIADLIMRLPVADHQALGLINYGGMSVKEAAGVMGVSVPAMKVRLHRARKKLQDLMDRECTIEPDENGKLCCDKKQPDKK